MRIIQIIISIFIVLIFASLTQAQEGECSLAPHMVVGQQGQVIVAGEFSDGMLRVRAEPNGAPRYDMLSGEQFSVISEGQCQAGFFWWEIVTAHGIRGWVAEGVNDYYFIDPLGIPNPDPLPTSPAYFLGTEGIGYIRQVEWRPDGEQIAVATTTSVLIYNANWEPVAQLPAGGVLKLSWGTNQLATMSTKGQFQIWDMTTFFPLLELTYPSRKITTISLDPQGRFIAATDRETLTIWELSSGEIMRTLEIPATALAWKADGTILAIAYPQEETPTVELWDIASNSLVTQLPDTFYFSLAINELAWSGDQVLLATTYEMLAWDTLKNTTTMSAITDVCGSYPELHAFSGNGEQTAYLEVGCDIRGRFLYLNILPMGEVISEIISMDDDPVDLAWHPTQPIITVAYRSYVEAISADFSQINRPLTLESTPPAPQRRLDFVGDQAIEISENGQVLGVLNFDTEISLLRSAFSPDGSRVMILTSDFELHLFSLSGEHLAEAYLPISSLDGQNAQFGWSPDNAWLYLVLSNSLPSDDPDQIFFWDTTTGNLLHNYTGRFGLGLQWSPDSTHYAYVNIYAGANTLEIRQINGDVRLSSDLELNGWSLAWNPEGTRLAVGGKNAEGKSEIHIWDTVNKIWLQTLKGHVGEMRTLAWSPDGSRLAGGDNAGTVRIYDPVSSQLLLTLEGGHQVAISKLKWSVDGSQLSSTDSDQVVSQWQIQ